MTCITLAWVEPEGDFVKVGEQSWRYSYQPILKAIPKACSVMWSHDDCPEMLEKARAYAGRKQTSDGTPTYVYQLPNTADVLEVARQRAMAEYKRGIDTP